MPAKLTSTELLRRYIDGRLTAPQEAELERRAATDTELGTALTALREEPEADHAAAVARIVTGAGAQVQASRNKGSVRSIRRYAVAATLLLLIVATALVLPRLMDSASSDLALQTEAPAAPEAREIAPLPTVTPPPEVTADPETAEAEEVSVDVSPQPRISRPEPVQEEAKEEMNADVVEEPAPKLKKAELPPAPASSAARSRREAAPPVTFDRSSDLRAGNSTPARVARPTYLKGRITDDNNAPLSGALIRLPGQPLGERTDSNGLFRFSADATLARILVSAPGYEAEEIEINNLDEELQISLEPRAHSNADADDFGNSASVTTIIMDETTGLPRFSKPPLARPAEGYDSLRKRLEREAPAGLEAGKVRVSFLVNPGGALTDFQFRGDPSPAVMDYVGKALVETSSWNVGNANEPVRVHFKLRLP